MNAGEWLKANTQRLREAGIATARLDCLILLEDALSQSRAWLLAHPEVVLAKSQLTILNTNVAQRLHHKPIAYIRGRKMFYGREFRVGPAVLVPRPETEMLIKLYKKVSSIHPLPARPKVADIGCGSGCIGITIALESPDAQVDMYDIDSAALTLAAANAKHYGIPVTFFHENLLSGAIAAHRQYDIIIANLPYVPEGSAISPAAAFEPRSALFAGKDGLDLYISFWQQIGTLAHHPTAVITEANLDQHDMLAALARSAGYTQQYVQGLAQLFMPV
jgi:release factor glutamine methyltransferase